MVGKRTNVTFTTQILTLYPEMFPGPLGTSLAGRALAENKWSCTPIQIRDFATDKHKSVDDTPAGGGAGMVMRADVLAAAVDHARAVQPDAPIFAMTPRGAPLTQARIREIASGPGVTILCGRFEGFDERIFDARADRTDVSIGDYILSGGELARDGVARCLHSACFSGVMGAASSGEEESFEQRGSWNIRIIPDPCDMGRTHDPAKCLRSGDHAKIAAWRKARCPIDDTRLRRTGPDRIAMGAVGSRRRPLVRTTR